MYVPSPWELEWLQKGQGRVDSICSTMQVLRRSLPEIKLVANETCETIDPQQNFTDLRGIVQGLHKHIDKDMLHHSWRKLGGIMDIQGQPGAFR